MKDKVLLTIFTGIFLALALQDVSAYTQYNYNSYNGNAYVYIGASRPYENYYGNYDRDFDVYSWDSYDLKWRKDPVNAWVQKENGWREEVIRARAVNWVANSYDDRYDMAYGRASGNVFYYSEESGTNKLSDWRNKETYIPAVHGTGNNYGGTYYYQPEYDPQSGTFNWRY